jgi:hypothetical protein
MKRCAAKGLAAAAGLGEDGGIAGGDLLGERGLGG